MGLVYGVGRISQASLPSGECFRLLLLAPSRVALLHQRRHLLVREDWNAPAGISLIPESVIEMPVRVDDPSNRRVGDLSSDFDLQRRAFRLEVTFDDEHRIAPGNHAAVRVTLQSFVRI